MARKGDRRDPRSGFFDGAALHAPGASVLVGHRDIGTHVMGMSHLNLSNGRVVAIYMVCDGRMSIWKQIVAHVESPAGTCCRNNDTGLVLTGSRHHARKQVCRCALDQVGRQQDMPAGTVAVQP